jgi:hypothetical protein
MNTIEEIKEKFATAYVKEEYGDTVMACATNKFNDFIAGIDCTLSNPSEFGLVKQEEYDKIKQQADKLKEALRWRLTTEEKPEHKQKVIVFGINMNNGKSLVFSARYHKGDDYNEEAWYHPENGFIEITHWMPLPNKQ